ncbi:MAG: peptide chain release factor N(5)-glutamine methyltransferase [Myxococcales bacterium]|nr:peptide chain release factor N(5)-glutamine methyltransferase [Myxococcales bacterium]
MSRERSWQPLDLVRWTAEYFGRHGVSTPRLDAEVLLAHVMGVDRMGLYLRFEDAVRDDQRARFRELVKRRAVDRVPVAYLTGVHEFWSLQIKVTPDVLIPRPETELLVETVRDLRPSLVAEIGTGSGALAAALARELPEAAILAVERSRPALSVARENLELLGVSERVTLVEGEGLGPVGPGFETIVSNPPYVRRAEIAELAPEVRHEPREALDGGADGLDLVRELCHEAPSRLARPGHLALEVGAGQAADVEELMREAGAIQVERVRDLAGIERVVLGRFGGD